MVPSSVFSRLIHLLLWTKLILENDSHVPPDRLFRVMPLQQSLQFNDNSYSWKFCKIVWRENCISESCISLIILFRLSNKSNRSIKQFINSSMPVNLVAKSYTNFVKASTVMRICLNLSLISSKRPKWHGGSRMAASKMVWYFFRKFLIHLLFCRLASSK